MRVQKIARVFFAPLKGLSEGGLSTAERCPSPVQTGRPGGGGNSLVIEKRSGRKRTRAHQVRVCRCAPLRPRVERGALGWRCGRARRLRLAPLALLRGAEAVDERAARGRGRRRRRRVEDSRHVVFALKAGERRAARVEHVVVVYSKLHVQGANHQRERSANEVTRSIRTLSSASPTTSGCLSPMCFSTNLRAEKSLLHVLQRNLPSSSCLTNGLVRR